MPRKKSKLTKIQRENADKRSRELAKLRHKRYREKLKSDPTKVERLAEYKEKAKVRAKNYTTKERKLRNNSKEYNDISRVLWRKINKKRAEKHVTWDEFREEVTSCQVSLAQKKRRRRERQQNSIRTNALHRENVSLVKKIKSLKVQLSRKRNISQDNFEIPTKRNKIDYVYDVQQHAIETFKERVSKIRSQGVKMIWNHRIRFFLESDDISKLLAGQTILDKTKLNVNRKKHCWHGKRVPKRVLKFTLASAYEMFCLKYPTFKLSLQTFMKRRPAHIVTIQKGAKKAKCVCISHSNVNRKLSALNKLSKTMAHLSIDSFSSPENLCEATLCPKMKDQKYYKSECINRNCSDCGTELLLGHYSALLEHCPSEVINWTKWEKVSKKKLDKKTGEIKWSDYQEVVSKKTYIIDMLEELLAELNVFSLHLFRTSWQWSQLRTIMAGLPKDEVLFISDFSENIPIQFSQETISSHVKPMSITLFVVAIYRHKSTSSKDNPNILFENVNILSDSQRHDSHFVQAATKLILEHCNVNYPECLIKVLHRYTDGCAGQFKSRHCMRDISFCNEDLGVDHFICNYGESYEFKNVTDGLGGVVKKLILDSILSNDDLVLSSPRDFVNYAKEHFEKTYATHSLDRRVFYYLEDQTIERNRPNRLGRPLAGIQSARCIKSISPGFVAIRNVSCYCAACLTHDWEGCLNKDYVNEYVVRHCRPERYFLHDSWGILIS